MECPHCFKGFSRCPHCKGEGYRGLFHNPCDMCFEEGRITCRSCKGRGEVPGGDGFFNWLLN